MINPAQLPVSEETTCGCVRWHRPPIRIIDVHHIVPKSWGGPDVKTNTVPICSNTHRLVHELLNLYKKRNGTPLIEELRPFPRYTKKLAQQGWLRYQEMRNG
jgi:hypothetical protein